MLNTCYVSGKFLCSLLLAASPPDSLSLLGHAPHSLEQGAAIRELIEKNGFFYGNLPKGGGGLDPIHKFGTHMTPI